MAGEKTIQSPELHPCNQDALYIFICIAGLFLSACILLLFYIMTLKRRQNGYAIIHGNENEVQKYKELYEEEKMEKENAIQRLCKYMSDRLTDGNPNVANLNDAKRPTKLAEELSELYDNEWTAAFESIDDKEEKEKVGFLLNILQIASEWSKDQAHVQLQKLKRILLFPGETDATVAADVSVSQDVMKSYKDSRKLLAEKTGVYVSNKVLEQVKENFEGSEWESALLQKPFEAYCRKCAELCWFLAVQDPPMVIQFSDVKSADLKAYTMSGNEIDFVVWPPLYLHEKGHLMCKGIAQFRMK